MLPKNSSLIIRYEFCTPASIVRSVCVKMSQIKKVEKVGLV